MTKHAEPAQPAVWTEPEKAGAPSYNFLLEANQRALTRWFHGVSALSQEIAEFTQNRLQEDMAAWSTLASCTNPEDAFECQRRFAEKATAGCAAEIAKLSQMMMNLANEGLESHQHGADRAS